MKQHIVRGARYAASFAVCMAHMLLALWAGSAAGGWAWRHGYTLPYDAGFPAAYDTNFAAAMVFGLLAAGAVVTLPEPWMTQLRFLIHGHPLERCPECDGLATAAEMTNARPHSVGPVQIFDTPSLALQNGEKTHQKETS